ncbi:MAG: pilus assembly protein PilM [bacterium]|nr:pilus assembly protein PilM [bacterium]
MKEEFLRMLPVPSFLFPRAIGLAIEDDGVSFVVNALPQDEFDAVYVPLAEDVITKGELTKPNDLTGAIVKIVSLTKNKDVVLSLPSDAGFLVRMEVEKEVPDIIEAVLFAIEEYVPVDPAELVVDVDNIGLSKEGKQRVVVSAYPEAIVRSYEDAVRVAGLNPVAAEMSVHSIARALVQQGGVSSTLVLHVGRTRSRAIIAVGGRPWLVSTIGIGWQKIVDLVARSGEMTEKEALHTIFTYGFSKTHNKELFNLMIPVAASFRDEIVKIVRFWESHKDRSWGRARTIEHVIVTGCGAAIPGIAEHLGVCLPVYVSTKSPFDELAYNAKNTPIISRSDSFDFTAGVGAYLRAQERTW